MKRSYQWLLPVLSLALAACGDGCGPPAGGEGESAEGEGDTAPGEGEGEEGEGEASEGEGDGPVICVRTGCDDCDSDGYYTCIDPAFPNRPAVLDCNDDAFSAQPDGVEFADNDVDDDCDLLIDEVEDCPCGDDGSASSLADAIGACGQTSQAVALGAQGQRQVGTSYFGVEARDGGCLLTTSTGVADFTNPASWPLQIDSNLVGRSPILDVTFVAVGSVRCTLEDGTVVDPCVSPLAVADIGNSGAHVLRIEATNDDGSAQPVATLVPVFVDEGAAPRLLWPDVGDEVGTRPRLVGEHGFGALNVVLERNGATRSAIPNVDDGGIWSMEGTALDGPLTAGEWTVTVGATLVGTITVTEDGDNGPPVSSVTSDRGTATIASARAEEVACTLDGEPITCRRGSNNLMATPGIHVMTVEATDIEGTSEVERRTFFVRVPWNEAPRLTLPGPSGNDAQPIIAGFADPGSNVEVSIDGTAIIGQQFASAIADVMGRWVVPAAAVPVLNPGNHSIEVSINFGDTNATRTYNYDPAGPDTGAIAYTLGPLAFAGPDSSAVGVQSDHPVSGAVINDVVGLRLQLRVPSNARGLAIDTMFISAEWPEFLCSDFNDSLDIFLFSGATAGQPSNIALDPDRDPLTVNNGFFELPTEWTTNLGALTQASTSEFGSQCGFPIDDACVLPEYCNGDPAALAYRGSGTGWLVAQGPVVPGERMEALFLVADVGDSSLDSLMLLSGLRWLPDPPPPGVLKPDEDAQDAP